MIVRTGTKTVYEIKYPLKSFATNVLKLKQGDKMAFSIAQHMSNKGGFYEFAGGIVNSKEITSAGILVLGEAKNLPSSGNSGGVTTSNAASNTTSEKNTGSGKVESNNQTVDGNVDSTVSDSSENTSSTGGESVSSEESNVTYEVVEEEGKSKKFPIVLILGVPGGLLAVLGAAFYFLFIRKK